MAKEDVATPTKGLKFADAELSGGPFHETGHVDFVRSPDSRVQRRAGHMKAKVGYRTRKCCCNDTWVDFTEDTSLHGLKYIWMRNIFVQRRLVIYLVLGF